MEKLDTLVADHIERRLLQPSRLEKILSSVLDRREERAERQAIHIAELRKRATEADAKLKRLYDAIENGVTDLSDLMLKDRIAELKAIRDQARADAERAEGAIERQGPTITTQSIKTFAMTARKRMRTEAGGYRRDYLHALAQRVEVDAEELRIMGSKSELLRTLVAASSAKTAGFGVPSSVPKWRAPAQFRFCRGDPCGRPAEAGRVFRQGAHRWRPSEDWPRPGSPHLKSICRRPRVGQRGRQSRYSAAFAVLAPNIRVGAAKPQDVPSVTLTWSSQGSR
jgi:hypothetical protein